VWSEVTLIERVEKNGRAEKSDVARSLQGDGEAYARIVTQHQTQVARRMQLFAREPAVIEELVQEVFVDAYFSLAGFRAEGTFDAWLATIATRVGYRHWKRKNRRRKDEVNRDGAWWQELAERNIDELNPTIARRLIQDLLGRLPPRDRLALLLIHVEGHSTAEAAELAGWSQTMVKVQAHRARGRLRGLLDKMGISSVRSAIEAAEKISHE
jgi:RNA polymerase sigma-70 factor, ECF subfamily